MDSYQLSPKGSPKELWIYILKKKVVDEGHQVKSLSDSVYSHHEERRKVHHESVHCVLLGNSSILNCWVAMTFKFA